MGESSRGIAGVGVEMRAVANERGHALKIVFGDEGEGARLEGASENVFAPLSNGRGTCLPPGGKDGVVNDSVPLRRGGIVVGGCGILGVHVSILIRGEAECEVRGRTASRCGGRCVPYA